MQNQMNLRTNLMHRVLAWTGRWARAFLKRETSAPVQPPVYWDDSVSLALSNLVQDAETRASGRVQIISLADFRGAIGELWPKYEKHILIIAESTIGRMIGKGNTFIPQGDDAWLLLFPGLPEDNAQQRADAIAATLGEKLLGAQFTSHEVPMPAAAKLDLTGAVNADGSLNMEAVKSAISRIKQTQISKVAAASKSVTPVPARATAPGTISRSTAEQLKTFFRPAWCAETESVDTFFFRATGEAGRNVYADTAPPCNDATILDLTKAAVTAFTAMCDTGLQAKMAIPVPFSTLHGAALVEIQRLIARLPQRDRLLRLRLEVVRIPDDITADMLLPIREVFRPYVREVAFVVDLAQPHEQVLALDHIMLGADLTELQGATDEQIFQEMLMFRQRAGRRGTYVLGVNTRTLVKHAIHAGVHEIGGPVVGDDLKRLPHRTAIIHRDEITAP
jgi:hypothetical protein